MGSQETVAALLRGVHLAALMSLFGSLLFAAVVAPPAIPDNVGETTRMRSRVLSVTRASAACALICGVAWLMVESAVIAGTRGMTASLHAVRVVALQTQFGQSVLLRLLLLIAIMLLRPARPLQRAGCIVLAGVALAVQPFMGHAGAVGGNVGVELIASEALHLLAAGAWLGGLLPLFIAVGTLPRAAATAACHRFTPIGLSAVLVLAGTAVVQVAEFIGGIAGLFGTAYGRTALVKLGLFLLLLLLAALNRLVLTERLSKVAALGARDHLRWSIAAETVLGTLVIITAGLLASQTPGTHEQPVWPFAWRPSLAAMADPDARREVTGALGAVGVGCVIGVIALLWRQVRWPAAALVVAICLFAIPHLDLLFVPAYPTSFYRSPTEFAATAIVRGAGLFAANCAGCHGAEGHGDGPVAQSLTPRPADLTAEHFWAHSDGELYWYIAHGISSPDGGVAMPGFAGVLSTEANWDLIDYMRAHNAGESMRRLAQWAHPLPVPQFDAECSGGRMINMDDLRGRVLRIIAAAGEEQAEPVSPGGADIATIVVMRERAARSGGSCLASEPEAWEALAILLGLSPNDLTGAQFLVDQNAWLRAAWRPGDPTDWANPQRLTGLIRDIAAHPIATDTTDGHVHRH